MGDEPSTSSSSSSSSSGGGTLAAVARAQQEALEAQTKIRLAEMFAKKKEDEALKGRALELDKELQIRAEGRRRAEEMGGRRPTQRKAGPCALAGVQCGALAVAAFAATQHFATALSSADAADVANRTLLLNLTAGGGVAVSSVLVVSTAILFTVAIKEGLGVVQDAPVTFYRCDGSGTTCCKNGPHNMGAHIRFTYLTNGRGFETRQKDSMRRHLLKSKQCRELKPVVVVPSREGWKYW